MRILARHRQLVRSGLNLKATLESGQSMSGSRSRSNSGIESVCLPLGLGTLTVGTDWGPGRATSGRYVWFKFSDSPAYLFYSTYDFSIDAESDAYATTNDRDSLRAGTMPDTVMIHDTPAFVRFAQAGCFGSCVEKTIVFPFEDHYFAVVYNFGEYDLEVTDWDTVREWLRAGNYPENHRVGIAQTDSLAQSLVFRQHR